MTPAAIKATLKNSSHNINLLDYYVYMIFLLNFLNNKYLIAVFKLDIDSIIQWTAKLILSDEKSWTSLQKSNAIFLHSFLSVYN